MCSIPLVPFAASAPSAMMGGKLVAVKNDLFFRGPVAELPVEPKRALASTSEFEYPDTIVCFPRCRPFVRPVVLPMDTLPVRALTPPCRFRRFERPNAVPTSAASSSLSIGSSSSSDNASPAVLARTISAIVQNELARHLSLFDKQAHLLSCYPAQSRHRRPEQSLLSTSRSLVRPKRSAQPGSVN
jgi:hypothetical protein